MSQQAPEDILVTIEQLCKRHPAFTKGGLRHLCHFDPDGFRDACVIRFGRKLLIDEKAFFVWVRANRNRPNLMNDTRIKKQEERGKA